MLRHYYISDNLDDLELIEKELEAAGIDTPQLHVFSGDAQQADVEEHHLHEVSSFMKRDVVRSGLIGFGIGLVAATLLLLAAYFFGWAETSVGWMPFIFLAIVLFGFSAWEGGLRGIQEPNQEFLRFKDALDEGKHIFFVDVSANQESALRDVTSRHPQLMPAGDGDAAPSSLIHGQMQFKRFIKAMP